MTSWDLSRQAFCYCQNSMGKGDRMGKVMTWNDPFLPVAAGFGVVSP